MSQSNVPHEQRLPNTRIPLEASSQKGHASRACPTSFVVSWSPCLTKLWYEENVSCSGDNYLHVPSVSGFANDETELNVYLSFLERFARISLHFFAVYYFH